jgi:acetyltransferase-like isoleucine patch superfamily enzyme
MKTKIEKIIQLRNPNFRFDQRINTGLLLILFRQKTSALLRGFILILKFKRPGQLLLGRKVRLINTGNIRLGKWVRLDDHVLLSATGTGNIEIGDNSGIGSFSRLIISTSFNNLGEFIKIGKNVGIGEFAYLGGGGGLEIGDDCIVGQYFSCHPENHNFSDDTVPIRLQGVTRKGIRIGKNNWIGSKVTVLDGVTIGDNCVIAAGSVVNRNVPSNSVIGGVPARILKKRIPDSSTPQVTLKHQALHNHCKN